MGVLMKKILVLAICVLTAFTVFSCSDEGGGLTIPGAPDLSPEEVSDAIDHFEEALSGDVPVESPPPEEPSTEEPPKEEPPAVEPPAESPPAEEPPAEEKKMPSTITVTAEISEGKWSTAPGKEQGGIYTLWERQEIILNISGVQKDGWFELGVEAKNVYGPLPDWYRFFTVNVSNETEGNELGGIFIPASDTTFEEGKMKIFLKEGDTELKLVWAGDAYDEGEYDTNILIGKIRVASLYGESVDGDDDVDDDGDESNGDEYADEDGEKGKGNKEIVRYAKEYSVLDGRWFFDKNSGWTHGANQYIGFSFPKLRPGKYRITIFAVNKGKLRKNYTHFEIEVSGDGVDSIAKVPASDRKYHRGSTFLDLTGGDTDIYLNWLNDEYSEGEYDTNIRIEKITLKKIGNSERSALAAYLFGSSQGNMVLIGGSLMLLLLLISTFFFVNKRRAGISA
jgi:hypothetical protein